MDKAIAEVIDAQLEHIRNEAAQDHLALNDLRVLLDLLAVARVNSPELTVCEILSADERDFFEKEIGSDKEQFTAFIGSVLSGKLDETIEPICETIPNMSCDSAMMVMFFGELEMLAQVYYLHGRDSDFSLVFSHLIAPETLNELRTHRDRLVVLSAMAAGVQRKTDNMWAAKYYSEAAIKNLKRNQAKLYPKNIDEVIKSVVIRQYRELFTPEEIEKHGYIDPGKPDQIQSSISTPIR